jgi:hypothetical protein
VYWSSFATKQWPALLATIAGEALYLSAGLRLLFELESELETAPAPGPGDHAGEDAAAARSRMARWVRRDNLGYAAAAVLALACLILGWAPRVLSGDGLGTWWRLPTLPIWAALLLPVAGAIVLYRAQDQVLRLTHTWWPWIEQHLSLDGLYRGVSRMAQSLGTLTWGATILVDGAGYMAWIVLVCLVVLLFIISR